MASLIFGQFRPFRGFGILFPQCEAFPDRVGGLWQKPVFPLFQSNEKRHASDSGFWIRRRQLPEMMRAVRGLRVPRGRGKRRVRIFLGKIRDLSLAPAPKKDNSFFKREFGTPLKTSALLSSFKAAKSSCILAAARRQASREARRQC